LGGRLILAAHQQYTIPNDYENKSPILIGKMTSKNPLLPSEEQCRALTDEQCHRIQAEVDPRNERAYKAWELKHQPTLIRLYMTGKSFPLIADAMKYKLEWS
jgi:hypothetical protein